MRRIGYYLVFILFSALSIVSCDVEPLDSSVDLTDTGSGGGTDYYFKIKIDGQEWQSNNYQALVNDSYISIVATKSDSSTFNILIPEGEVDTYTWSDFGPISVLGLSYIDSNSNTYISLSDTAATAQGFTGYTDTAEVKITEINTQNHTIRGTIRFTGGFLDDDTTLIKTFTEGEFYLPYTENTTSPSNNTFMCKLDGQNYTPTDINGYIIESNISIIGRRGNIENISLLLPQNITVGTYEFDFGNIVGIYNPPSFSNSFVANSGSVTITTHNTSTKHIVGTFNFIASTLLGTDSHQVTDGTFDVYYQ